MNRRDLLKSAGVLAAGSAVPAGANGQLVIDTRQPDTSVLPMQEVAHLFTRASTAHYWQGDELWKCGPDGKKRIV